MLNLNIDYSTAVILSSTQKRETTIEEKRQKCVDNSKTQVLYDATSKRVIFRFAFATSLYKVSVGNNADITSSNIVADTQVSAEKYAENKSAYRQALIAEINAGKLDDFLNAQSALISQRLTKAHADRKAAKQH
jgi:hypothetical protein